MTHHEGTKAKRNKKLIGNHIVNDKEPQTKITANSVEIFANQTKGIINS